MKRKTVKMIYSAHPHPTKQVSISSMLHPKTTSGFKEKPGPPLFFRGLGRKARRLLLCAIQFSFEIWSELKILSNRVSHPHPHLHPNKDPDRTFSKDEMLKGKMTRERRVLSPSSNTHYPHTPLRRLPARRLIIPVLIILLCLVQNTDQGVLSLGLRHQNSTHYTEC